MHLPGRWYLTHEQTAAEMVLGSGTHTSHGVRTGGEAPSLQPQHPTLHQLSSSCVCSSAAHRGTASAAGSSSHYPKGRPLWTVCASRRSIRACHGWQGRMGSRALSCPADKGAQTCQITQVGGGWREVVHAQNLLLKWKQNQKPDRAEVILVEIPLLFSSCPKPVSVCSRLV